MKTGLGHRGQNKLLFCAVNIACCFLLLFPAFYNGYPIVNSDFGTYLPSGFKPEMPVDRPITYGILLRIFSLNGLSLWPPLFAQAFFVSNLLIRLVKNITERRNYLLLSLLIIAFLSFFTGLSWTVSQLQPDIYTGIAFLCLAVLLTADENKTLVILTYVLYFVAIGTHISHVMLFCLLLLVVIIFKKTGLILWKKRLFVLLALSVLPVLTMLPPIAKSKHMFFMASLMEKGILSQYLDEECPATPYRICAYKDDLPETGDDFLWDANAPAYKEGGWAAVKDEYNAITRDILNQRRYQRLFIKASARFTVRQLASFEIGPGNIAFREGTYVYDNIARYVPGELQAFAGSRQNRSDLLEHTGLPNTLFSYVLLFCLVGIFISIVILVRQPRTVLGFFVFLVVTGIVLNAWDCATFSVINGRYGCRMAWLLPFALLLMICDRFPRKSNKIQNI